MVLHLESDDAWQMVTPKPNNNAPPPTPFVPHTHSPLPSMTWCISLDKADPPEEITAFTQGPKEFDMIFTRRK